MVEVIVIYIFLVNYILLNKFDPAKRCLEEIGLDDKAAQYTIRVL